MTDETDNSVGKVPSVFLNRRLDLVTKASIDVVSLNNMILKMRPKVRASKKVIISKLRDRIKKLKNMKGTDEQKQKNEQKAKEREKEIGIIKALNQDHVSKFAIGATEKLETVFCKPGVTVEEIALVRLASHKYIQDKVQEFRKKHTDWKELGAYLMTKHTNREFKKKKSKPDAGTKQTKQSKRMIKRTNIEASETMVKSYLNEKLRDEDIESGNDDDGGDGDVDFGRSKSDKGITGESDDASKSGKVRTGDDTDIVSRSEETGSDDDGYDDENKGDSGDSDEGIDTDSNSDDDTVKEPDGELNNYLRRTSDSDKDCPTEEEEDVSDTYMENVDKKHSTDTGKTSKQEKDRKNCKKSRDESMKKDKKNRDESGSVKKLKKANVESAKDDKKPVKPNIFEKVQGEIIVKKLNLDEWCENETLKDTGKVPEILLADETRSKVENTDENVKRKKKAFDPFFDTGDRLFQSRDSKPGELGKNLLAFAGYTNEDETLDQAIDNSVEASEYLHEKDNDDDNDSHHRNFIDNHGEDIFSEKSRRDGSVYIKANHMGKQAFRTTFMESLNNTGKRDFPKKAPRKDKAPNRERGQGKDKHFQGKQEFRKAFSAGTKEKLKKKGLLQNRDSRKEELGGSLLAIAGYDRESRTGSSGTDTGSEKGLWDKKGSPFKGRKEDNNKKAFGASHGANNQNKARAIHPSWEASMKRKQQESSVVEFTGKKIKFDDDD